MKGIAFFILATSTLVGCGKQDLGKGNASFLQGKVVYGEDGREDVVVFPDYRFRSLAQSTAVQIPKTSMSNKGSYYELESSTLGQKLNLCPEERFAQQSAAGRCSGFLVAPKILVTAGHCITKMSDCSNSHWVFDYQTQDPYGKVTSVSASNVYSCSRIIEQKLDRGRGTDFAVIELDRAVAGRTPLKFRTSGQVGNQEGLVVIGNPSGLPTKITAGGSVRDNSDYRFFVASVDTFQGNSGSAVFNERTGVVEGILVRGETDYKQDYARGCRTVNVCTEYGCRGEDVTRITMPESLKGLIYEESDEVALDQDSVEVTKSALELPIEDFKLTTLALEVNKNTHVDGLVFKIKLAHSYVGDLAIGLRHPDGEVIVLRNRQGARGTGLEQEFSTDELSSFVGKNAFGKWEVLIKDFARQDQGSLQFAQLVIN
ncbi:MAG: trypsin-like peptidase domain-containing protein [Bacteriovoracaceae bacterium]